jgi:hypothetical protein
MQFRPLIFNRLFHGAFFGPQACLFVYLLVTPPSFGAATAMGPGTGGGGGGVVCMKTGTSEPKSVELVDLVESVFYDKTVLSKKLAKLPWETQVKMAVDRIAFADPQFHSMLVERVRTVKQELSSSMTDTKNTDLVFPAPQDLSHGRVPPLRLGCQVAGIAVYNDGAQAGTRLKVSHHLWKKLSNMHKAALVLHESVYLTHRDIYRNLSRDTAPDSSATRALVGFLLSKELEDNSATKAERELFAKSSAYRGYLLPAGNQDPKNGFRARVQTLLRPLAPYFLKDMERPLFLGSRLCEGKSYTVKVIDDDSSADKVPGRCELKTRNFQGIGNAETRVIKPDSVDGKTSTYSYSPQFEDILEDLRLDCRTESALRHHNPGFKIYCGANQIADVAGNAERDLVGLSLKSKKEFEETFLHDFDFADPTSAGKNLYSGR